MVTSDCFSSWCGDLMYELWAYRLGQFHTPFCLFHGYYKIKDMWYYKISFKLFEVIGTLFEFKAQIKISKLRLKLLKFNLISKNMKLTKFMHLAAFQNCGIWFFNLQHAIDHHNTFVTSSKIVWTFLCRDGFTPITNCCWQMGKWDPSLQPTKLVLWNFLVSEVCKILPWN
jgi:hypothetical protein